MPLAWISFGWLVEKILLQFARFLRELKRLGLWDDFSSATLFSAALIAEMLDNFGTLFIRGNGRCWEIKRRTRGTGQKASQPASSRPVASTKAFHRKLVANFSRRVASSTYFPSNIPFVLREQETSSDTPTVRDRMIAHITFLFFIFEYTG